MIVSLLPDTAGRDFILGDLHGRWTMLEALLSHVHFEPQRDRLIVTGDLFDRGDSPLECLHLLNQPWFFSVRGNHEQNLINWHRASHSAKMSKKEQIIADGGGWFFALAEDERAALCKKIENLPMVILVSAGERRLAVLHAEIPENMHHFDEFLQALWQQHPAAHHSCLVGRRRRRLTVSTPVADIDLVICDHTPVEPSRCLRENTLNLDFGLPPRHPQSGLGLFDTASGTLCLCSPGMTITSIFCSRLQNVHAT